MRIIYSKQSIKLDGKSLFLAGPTLREKIDGIVSWRIEALKILEEKQFNGTVMVPENEGFEICLDHCYADQIEWEEAGLRVADCILFWIPRDLKILPAFTTNDEFGAWKYSGKCVLGVPPGAPKCKYQIYYARKLNIPFGDTLNQTIHLALEKLECV